MKTVAGCGWRRWAAGCLVVLFLGSGLPLQPAGAGRDEGFAGAAGSEGAGAVERVADAAAPAKKRLPVIAIVAGAAVFAAVTVLLYREAKRTKYNIVGSWQLKWKYNSETNLRGPIPLRFEGGRAQGSVYYGNVLTASGSYQVKEGRDVAIIISAFTNAWNYTGRFEKADRLSGTHAYGSKQGTWIAVRGSEEF